MPFTTEPTTVQCTNVNHEHLDEFDRYGESLDCLVPMKCHHCGAPSHWDESAGDYGHDDRSISCFLISAEVGQPCS